MLHHIIIVAFLFSIVYGFFESLIFLLSEKYIQDELIENSNLDLAMTELFIGGVSASLSFVIATSIGRYFRYKSSYGENIFIDGLGILLGTLTVIFIYWILDMHLKFRTGI